VELRDKLFSAIYMLRSDVAQTVCQASFQVWKSVVQSQLRTLRTILPTLMNTLIACLSSSSQEKQVVAGSSMGELVSKVLSAPDAFLASSTLHLSFSLRA